MSYDEHQAMWPQMIAALAAIDEALGLPAVGTRLDRSVGRL